MLVHAVFAWLTVGQVTRVIIVPVHAWLQCARDQTWFWWFLDLKLQSYIARTHRWVPEGKHSSTELSPGAAQPRRQVLSCRATSWPLRVFPN